jgi:hypothetical protein
MPLGLILLLGVAARLAASVVRRVAQWTRAWMQKSRREGVELALQIGSATPSTAPRCGRGACPTWRQRATTRTMRTRSPPIISAAAVMMGLAVCRAVDIAAAGVMSAVGNTCQFRES